MTYDYAGSWNPTSGLNSPLFSSSSNSYSQADTMAAYVRAGVPRGKLTLGLSFYGRGYYVDSAYNGGLGARQTGVPSAGSEPGVYTWKALRSGVLSNGPYSPAWDFQRVYRTDIQNPTLYSPSQKIFIAYDVS